MYIDLVFHTLQRARFELLCSDLYEEFFQITSKQNAARHIVGAHGRHPVKSQGLTHRENQQNVGACSPARPAGCCGTPWGRAQWFWAQGVVGNHEPKSAAACVSCLLTGLPGHSTPGCARGLRLFSWGQVQGEAG